MTKVTPEDYDVTIHESAQKVVRDMQARVADLGRFYGESSPQYTKAVASLANVLTTLLTMGDVRMTRDGDLSLYGVTSYGLHFGLIGHRNAVPAEYAEYLGEPPVPVEWSFHS